MDISATAVRFDDNSMWVDLSDGRTIGVPYAWFPRLLAATPKQRQTVEIGRFGLHWESIDEDISIAGLLVGREKEAGKSLLDYSANAEKPIERIEEPSAADVSGKDRLQILLAEYNTLRAEAIQRNSVLIQVMTVGGSVLTTILTFSIAYRSWAIFALVVILSNALVVAYKIVEFDILRFSLRLRVLEEEVNRRAGERLLIWETEQGLPAVGPEHRVRYIQATYLTLGQWGTRMLVQACSQFPVCATRAREIWKRIARSG